MEYDGAMRHDSSSRSINGVNTHTPGPTLDPEDDRDSSRLSRLSHAQVRFAHSIEELLSSKQIRSSLAASRAKLGPDPNTPCSGEAVNASKSLRDLALAKRGGRHSLNRPEAPRRRDRTGRTWGSWLGPVTRPWCITEQLGGW